MEKITSSPEETKALGKELAGKLKGKTILLFGELGAGKTHFIQGLAAGLGIKKRILSPTFIFIRPYEKEHFYHIDLYRIEEAEQIRGLGLEEILEETKATIAIEWPEKIESWLEHPVKIYLERVDSDTRRIRVLWPEDSRQQQPNSFSPH